MDSMKRYNSFIKILQEDVPNLEVKVKQESLLMKLISYILFFNKGFMTKFITTLGDTIYFPEGNVEKDPLGAIMVVAHEYAHIKRSHKVGNILYSFLYLMPLPLALLAIPAAFVIGWWSLLFLLFLAPLPAYWRMETEVEGYTMSLFILRKVLQEYNNTPETIEAQLNSYAKYTNKNFTGPSYYWMWVPGVEDKLEKATKLILSDDILETSDIYAKVQDALERSKLLAKNG